MRILTRLLCKHADVLKADGNRVFVKCFKCQRESEGILTGGHRYNPARCGCGKRAIIVQENLAYCQFCWDCIQHEQALGKEVTA